MNEKEVIMFLRDSKPTIPYDSMERCVDSLPMIKKSSSLLPLIKIQIYSMPISAYVSTLVAVVFQISFAVNARPEQALFMTGISSSIVAMLFSWHFVLSYVGSMSEIEKTCKYSYGQILLTRVLCVCVLTLTAMLAAMIPNAGISQIGIPFLFAAVLPTVIGASSALLWAGYMENSNFSQMTVYLVTALITSFLLEVILKLGVFFLVAILLSSSTTLFIQIKNLMNRRMYYEVYNY